MKKADIVIPLGLAIMELNKTLTALKTERLLRNFFKGCSTIAKMQERVKINGGRGKTAEKLAQQPNRCWRIR